MHFISLQRIEASYILTSPFTGKEKAAREWLQDEIGKQ
jgi:hypothetical protein